MGRPCKCCEGECGCTPWLIDSNFSYDSCPECEIVGSVGNFNGFVNYPNSNNCCHGDDSSSKPSPGGECVYDANGTGRLYCDGQLYEFGIFEVCKCPDGTSSSDYPEGRNERTGSVIDHGSGTPDPGDGCCKKPIKFAAAKVIYFSEPTRICMFVMGDVESGRSGYDKHEVYIRSFGSSLEKDCCNTFDCCNCNESDKPVRYNIPYSSLTSESCKFPSSCAGGVLKSVSIYSGAGGGTGGGAYSYSARGFLGQGGPELCPPGERWVEADPITGGGYCEKIKGDDEDPSSIEPTPEPTPTPTPTPEPDPEPTPTPTPTPTGGGGDECEMEIKSKTESIEVAAGYYEIGYCFDSVDALTHKDMTGTWSFSFQKPEDIPEDLSGSGSEPDPHDAGCSGDDKPDCPEDQDFGSRWITKSQSSSGGVCGTGSFDICGILNSDCSLPCE